MTTAPSPEDWPALYDLTRVERADVYKVGQLAAHITRTPDGNVFTYTRDWIANDGPAVATTLPVTSVPVTTTGGAVPAYFAGLLPEGRRLSALRRNIKTSADDELALVLGVGGDAVGDVTVLPEGTAPSAIEPRLVVEDWEHVRFADLLEDLDVHIDHVGIPGVQDKVSLAMLNLPVSAAGHRYLLKLDPPEFPHLVENEHFFLQAAKTTGIDVNRARIVRDAENAPGLVVTRFDRIKRSDGTELPLAVEDGCQVFGLHPEAKYRIPTEQLLAKLASLCNAPIPAARSYLQQIAFAYVTGNGDAHAKNFSIAQDPHGRWAPSPAYDLPSSQPYGDNTLALSVAGKRDGNIPGRNWIGLGVLLGLPEPAARRAIATVCDNVDTWIDELRQLPFDPGRIKKLRRVVGYRRDMLRVD